MRKKYLSALLFGALLVTSAGTFTSCKDYDDDINNLQEQITANADAIKALEELVKAGKYVSAVSGNGNVITFTFTDGTTQQVTVESAEQETQTVTIGEDGEVIINGEGTGFYTTKTPSEEEVEAGLVKKGANGTWEVSCFSSLVLLYTSTAKALFPCPYSKKFPAFSLCFCLTGPASEPGPAGQGRRWACRRSGYPPAGRWRR